MSLAPLDLVSAHPWRRAAFTTYALSLSFFEAVLLDALVRGGGREALILADVDGVRAALSEHGARRVGKDYEVEPIAVTAGVFHPKISVFTGDDSCHLLVGSGNLTFGGWGGNFEVLEHLHPGFAADAIEDAAVFFTLLSTSDRVRHCAADRCSAIASDLRASIRDQPRNGNIRLFHSLDGAITGKLAETVADLGGAERLVVAAPFWDRSAIDTLCKALGIDHVYVHAHAGGSVEGFAGSNWPAQTASTVHAVRIHLMEEENSRRLHAKVIEVMCKRGRVLISGSPNITAAALGENHNVEACVARIQHERTLGWTYSAAIPPELRMTPDDEVEDSSEGPGVLRAVVAGDQISGQVLTPKMSGAASAFQLTTEGPEPLGEVALGKDGDFQLSAPGLEVQSWKGGRLVLRVQSASGRMAEGFVSVAAFTEITRRAGNLGPRLLAILAGTETPADVAAIMSWFHEDPRRLGSAMPVAISGGASSDTNGTQRGATVAVADLNSAHAVALTAWIASDRSGYATWSRFMDHVFAAFRERRGPFGGTSTGYKGEDDDDDLLADVEVAPVDLAVERSLAIFERLFELLLSPENMQRFAMSAFDLTQYVCERLQPDADRVRVWLHRLIDSLIRASVPLERREDVAAAILTLLGARSDTGGIRGARSQLLRLGIDLSGRAPTPDGVRGFQSVLMQTAEFSELWTRLQAVRTFQEQTRAYLSDLDGGRPSAGYADLAREAPEEWPILAAALVSERPRKKILVLHRWAEACPHCHIVLPNSEIHKLRSTSLATARNCCGRVVIWVGD